MTFIETIWNCSKWVCFVSYKNFLQRKETNKYKYSFDSCTKFFYGFLFWCSAWTINHDLVRLSFFFLLFILFQRNEFEAAVSVRQNSFQKWNLCWEAELEWCKDKTTRKLFNIICSIWHVVHGAQVKMNFCGKKKYLIVEEDEKLLEK